MTDFEKGDVVWFNGAGISHRALIVEIDEERNDVTVADELANTGNVSVGYYDLDEWRPDDEAINDVFTDWDHEKKIEAFGVSA